MSNPSDKDFILVIESKIKHLKAERENLRPIVDRYERLAAQIDLLSRTRNSFVHNQQIDGHLDFLAPHEVMRPSFRGELGTAVIAVLREESKPVHVDELVRKLTARGIAASKNQVAGVLGRAYQLKEIDRPAEHTYQVKGD